MHEELTDRTVVITGAASGIGKATALGFARERYNIVAVARSEKGLNELVPECELMGAVVLTQIADVTDQIAMNTVAANAIDSFGGIDVWVNNAGVLLVGKFEELPHELFRRVIDTNLFGCIHGTRAVLPHFREQHKGTLINVASFAAKTGLPYASAYSISKAGIGIFSDSLRMELADTPDIHVCAVFPASIDTPLFQNAANYSGRALKPISPVYKAEKVAHEIVKLSRKPKREVVVGAFGKVGTFSHYLAPALTEKLLSRSTGKDQFQEKAQPISDGNLYNPNDECTSISGGWTNNGRGLSVRQKAAVGLGALAPGIGVLGWLFRRLYLRYV